MSDRPQLPGYDVLQQLGTGGAGRVWAVRRADAMRFAAKVVTDVQGADDALRHEAALLQAIRHEHVVRLYDVVRAGDDAVALVMQLAEGGSLADSLRTRDHLTPGELVTVLCPVARALHDLHSMGLIHGDLSPSNLLFTQEGKPLIADLGFAHLAGQEDSSLWGSESWSAPEVMAGEPPTPASDVYSLGAIAWSAVAGGPPEHAALRPDLADLAPSLSPELHDLIVASLSHLPQSRPTPEDFALTLWRVATPDPAPIQGSPGRRTADGVRTDDPAAALTRRIRDDAQRENCGRHRAAGDTPSPVWRRPAIVRTAGAATFVGLIAGGLMLIGNESPARAGRGPVTSVSNGAAPTRTAPASTAVRTGVPSTRRPRTSAATAAAASQVALDRQQQLRRSPATVLQRLVDARAQTWTTGRTGELSTILVMGSSAYRADSADLGTAHSRGIRFVGLSFQVRDARLVTAAARTAQVEATMDRSAYVVTESGLATSVAARPALHTRMALTLTPAGWRIASWVQG